MHKQTTTMVLRSLPSNLLNATMIPFKMLQQLPFQAETVSTSLTMRGKINIFESTLPLIWFNLSGSALKGEVHWSGKYRERWLTPSTMVRISGSRTDRSRRKDWWRSRFRRSFQTAGWTPSRGTEGALLVYQVSELAAPVQPCPWKVAVVHQDPQLGLRRSSDLQRSERNRWL